MSQPELERERGERAGVWRGGMTTQDAKEFVDNLMSAIGDYVEAKAALEEARSEYTGYSPGYALAPWYERKAESRDRIVHLLMPLLAKSECAATGHTKAEKEGR